MKTSSPKYQVDSKMCSKCGNALPSRFFYKQSASPDGLQSYCKACTREVKQERYKEKRESILLKNNNYYHTNKEKILRNQSDRRKRNPRKSDEWNKQKRNRIIEMIESGETIVPDTQVCKGCGIEKPISEYYTNYSYTIGVMSKCKACVYEGVKQRRSGK